MADEAIIETLKIEITGDSSGAVDGVEKLINTLQKIKGATTGGNKGLDSLTQTLNKVNEAVSKIKPSAMQKLKYLSEGIKGLSDVGKIKFGRTSEGIMALGYAVDSLKDVDFTKLSEMAGGVQTLSSAGNINLPKMRFSGASGDNTVEKSFEGISGVVSGTVSETSSMLAKITASFKKFGKDALTALKKPKEAFKDFQAAATKAFSKIKSAAATTGKAIKGYFKALTAPFRPLVETLSGFGDKFKNLFAMFNKRAMYRALNSIISAITQGFKEGTENVYQYSKAINGRFADSMDRMTTAMLYFKNSIGAAVAPILNMLAPAIDVIADKSVELINTFNQLFARLSGANTWTRAIRYPKEYAEAATDATEANEELKKTILGFDQLNVLQDNSTSDSGNSNTADDYSRMFEEVALTAAENPFEGFFTPFKEAWANEGQNTIDALKKSFEQVKELISAVKESYDKVWQNGTGQQTIETILRIFQNVVGTVGNLAESLKRAWKENETGTGIVQEAWDIFNSVLGTIERITDATKKWAENLNFSPLLESIHNFLEKIKPLVDNIGKAFEWVWNNVILPVSKWAAEDLAPAGIDLISAAIDLLNSVIEKAKPLLKWLWDEFFKPLSEWAGDKVVDALKSMTDLLNDLNDLLSGKTSFGEFIDQLSFGQAVLLGVAAAVGIVVGAFVVFQTISAIVSGVGAVIGFLTSPIGIAVAAIAVLIAIGALLVTHWEEIKTVAIKVWTAIKDFFKDLAEKITDFAMSAIDGLFDFMTDAWDGMISVAKAAWGGFKDFWSGLWDIISNAAKNVWNAIKTFFSNTWDSIKNTATNVWNAIKTFFSNTWDSIKNTATNVWNAIKTFFSNTWDSIKNTATNVWNAIKSFFSNTWDSIKNTATNVWNAIKTFFSNTWDSIKNTATNVWNAIKTFFSNTWDSIKNTATNVWNGVKTNILNVVTGIKNGITTAFDFIRDHLSSVMERIRNTMVSVWDSIKNGIRTPINAIIGFVESMINGVIKGFNGMINALNKLSFDVPDWVPGIGGSKFGFNIQTLQTLSIPRLENGGVVNAGTMFIAGEAGAEVVAQMGNRTGVMNTDEMQASVERGILNASGSLAAAVASAIIRAQGSEGNAPIVDITITADSETIYKAVRKGEKYYNNRYHVVAGV